MAVALVRVFGLGMMRQLSEADSVAKTEATVKVAGGHHRIIDGEVCMPIGLVATLWWFCRCWWHRDENAGALILVSAGKRQERLTSP